MFPLSALRLARRRTFATCAARKAPQQPPKPEPSRHALFYADLTALAPVFLLACTTYLGLKLIRERCLLDKQEYEAKENLASLERELDDLLQQRRGSSPS
ncbi:hypothetical protein EXIGLDRAFT_715929, partial [Exidia glandulosa HHB12029]